MGAGESRNGRPNQCFKNVNNIIRWVLRPIYRKIKGNSRWCPAKQPAEAMGAVVREGCGHSERSWLERKANGGDGLFECENW